MIALHPFSGARIELLVTNLIGDVKGQWFTDSATEACDKARETAAWPDTVVWFYDTLNGDVRGATPNARVQRDGVGPAKYHSL
jgi:hypothetical protein